MKKRILSMLLAIMVAVAFMPVTAFGAVKAKPAHQSDELVSLKQDVLEFLSTSFDDAVDDQQYYIKDIWTAINNIYDREVKRINNASTREEIVEMDEDLVLLPAYETQEVIMKLTYMGTLTKNKGIKGKDPMARCTKAIETYKDKVCAQYKLSSYNGWYRDVVSGIKTDLNNQVKKLKRNPTYDKCADVGAYIGVYDMDDESNEVFSYLTELFGFTYYTLDLRDDMEIDLSKPAYTNDELFEDRMMMYSSLLSYIDELMSIYKTKLKPEKKTYDALSGKLTSRADEFYEQSENEPELEAIVDMYDKATDDIYKLSELKGKLIPATESDKQRLRNAIDKLYKSYDQTLYSEGKVTELGNIFETATLESDIFTFTKDENANDKTRRNAIDAYVAELKVKAGKVPVKSVELKQEKAKYKKSIKSKYAVKGTDKYNQEKVKTLLAEANKAVDKCADIQELSKVKRTYTKKLDNTINKYKVRTSKKGKGTITKGKTVKYGSSFTVKFTPKAGWKIARIYVDGKKLKKLKSSHTFKKVKKPHSIKVVFTR